MTRAQITTLCIISRHVSHISEWRQVRTPTLTPGPPLNLGIYIGSLFHAPRPLPLPSRALHLLETPRWENGGIINRGQAQCQTKASRPHGPSIIGSLVPDAGYVLNHSDPTILWSHGPFRDYLFRYWHCQLLASLLDFNFG